MSMNLGAIIACVAMLLSLMLGITVFSLARRHFVGKTIIGSLLLLLIIEFSFVMIFLQQYDFKIVLWGKIAMSGFCLLLPTWVLVSLVFTRSDCRELLKQKKWYLSFLYGIGAVFLMAVWKVDFFFVSRSFPEDLFFITGYGKYFFIFAFLSTVLILLNLENTLHVTKISSRKGRKVPLVFLIGAFLFWIYGISQILMYSMISRQLAITSFYMVLLTTLVLIFYIIKFGLTQLEVNVGRNMVYSSAMIFIVGTYVLVIGIVGKIIQYAGGNVNLFLTFLAAMIVFCLLLATLVSRSIKERIRLFVDRNLYRNRYDYREQWGKFSESLSAVLNLDDVLTMVLENITDIFSARNSAILWQDESNAVLIVKKTKNCHDIHGVKFVQKSRFIDWFHRLGEAIETSTIVDRAEEIELTASERDHLLKLEAAVCVPMIIQKKFMGILTVGQKSSQDSYSKEDFDLLETLANQASVAIQNAKLNEELLISREMASFHKLSSFVMHDLKNAASMLSMVIQNAEINWNNQEFQKDMLQTISDAAHKMKSLISKITSLPAKLEPKRQPVQINEMIRKVIKEAKIDELKSVALESDFQQLPLLAIDSDQIEKVIQNLVINALEALPDGGSLKICTRLINNNHAVVLQNEKLDAHNQFAEIEISDSGIGMTEEFMQQRLFKPFQTTKKKGLGIGLFQCKEIITAHGGTIEVQSKVNEGTSFTVLLPISNGHTNSEDFQPMKYDHAISLN